MRFLVTGAAGFIGSQLCQRLIGLGHQVTGVDCFTDYYAPSLKKANLAALADDQAFHLINEDLASADLPALLEPSQAVLHLAAQAGVRASWGNSFDAYIHHNITVTQKLLEAMREFPYIPLVYASSSSVYGQAQDFPTRETSPCQPLSPYGVSKLAAENLCQLYHANYGLPTVCLRFFTVYGPRQRPDMAFHRFIRAMLEKREITLWGDGGQSRDFTFVDDIINAVIMAATTPAAQGRIFNLGGGDRADINRVLAILQEQLGVKARIKYHDAAKGDVRDTFADTALARQILNFTPSFSLERGLATQVEWTRQNLGLLQKT